MNKTSLIDLLTTNYQTHLLDFYLKALSAALCAQIEAFQHVTTYKWFEWDLIIWSSIWHLVTFPHSSETSNQNNRKWMLFEVKRRSLRMIDTLHEAYRRLYPKRNDDVGSRNIFRHTKTQERHQWFQRGTLIKMESLISLSCVWKFLFPQPISPEAIFR